MSLPDIKEERPLTGEDLLRRPDLGPCELVGGRVVPMTPTGFQHGWIESRLATFLSLWAESTRRGFVLTGEVGVYIRRNPDTVRAGDVLFISAERPAGRGASGYLTVPPELVVEILSPEDHWRDVQAKLDDYFSAGVDRIWIVDPKARRISVYFSPSQSQTFEAGQTLTDEELLPGFSLLVSEVLP
jgi:Uma2 family endonuclease